MKLGKFKKAYSINRNLDLVYIYTSSSTRLGRSPDSLIVL